MRKNRNAGKWAEVKDAAKLMQQAMAATPEDVTGNVSGVVKSKDNRDYKIVLTLCDGDFERSMGRQPGNQAEFDDWARLLEKGLLNGHIDWDVLYNCTRQAMGDVR